MLDVSPYLRVVSDGRASIRDIARPKIIATSCLVAFTLTPFLFINAGISEIVTILLSRPYATASCAHVGIL